MIFQALWIFASLRGSWASFPYFQMFVIEQALWRDWESVIFVENKFEVEFYKNLSSFHLPGAVTSQLPTDDSRHGFVFFWPGNITRTEYSLLVISEKQHVESLRLHLNELPLTITTDMIVAVYEPVGKSIVTLTLQQVYKKGPAADVTLRELGNWLIGQEPVFKFKPPEIRTASRDVFINVGIKNTSVFDENGEWDFANFVDRDEEVAMLTLLHSLFSAMNISYKLVVFTKLGRKSAEGGWTHLLGAVADGSVHVAADTMDQSLNDGNDALRLTDPIVETMSCIYFRKAGNGRLHDVVRATFSNELQISVLATGILLWIAMLAITVATARFSEVEKEFWEPTEALIWAVSVLCMQGSPWAPKSLSGCILLIFSLMFALITYNSYAAFITSVLSAQTSPFRSVKDFMNADYRFGFTKGSSDELFFQITDDLDLRAFYYRSLMTGDSVSDITDGMLRASEGQYAFFAMARMARRALQSHVPPQSRCRVHELCVKSTVTSAGIPLSRTSPYNPLIHYWLIRFRETGVLSRIQSQLLPPMPSCLRGQQFSGASVPDLLSAYFLLTLGILASLTIFILEVIWSKRKRLFTMFGHKSPNKFQARIVEYRGQRPRSNNWTYLY